MRIDVPEHLLQRVPKGLAHEAREDYLIAAMEVGLRALSQASIDADTAVVKDTFDRGAAELIKRVHDLVNDLFGREDSPFHRAMNPHHPDSKVASLLQQVDHRMEKMLEDVSKAIAKMEEEHKKDLNAIKEKFNIDTAVAEEAKVGTKKGREFEHDILEAMTGWQKYSDSFENIGSQQTGNSKRKVGDLLATLDNGSRIVFEIKAGSNYQNTGDKSLNRQMDEAMNLRDAVGAIAVTTVDAMNGKKWQHTRCLDTGKNRLIVAVDRETGDFTMLKLVYTLLRERIIAQTSQPTERNEGLSEDVIKEHIRSIEQALSSTKKLRQLCTDFEGKIGDLRQAITSQNSSIQNAVGDLYDYLSSVGHE